MTRRPSEYRTDLAPWSLCVAELVKLANEMPKPEGMRLLGEFTRSKQDFCEELTRVEGSVIVVAVVPTAKTLAFLDKLRRIAAGQRAA